MEALTSLSPKLPETMSVAAFESAVLLQSLAYLPPHYGPRVLAPTIHANHRLDEKEMFAVINSVTKAADRDDMLCDDVVGHLNSSSPGCRGSNESWNRGARLSTYRAEVLLVRHNFDVMHIEKNLCHGILGTLLKSKGKSKDGLKSRKDLEAMPIRQDLQLK